VGEKWKDNVAQKNAYAIRKEEKANQVLGVHI